MTRLTQLSPVLFLLVAACVSPRTFAVAQQPAGRACLAAAYADHLRGTVVFGGARACGVDVLADDTLWLWNSQGWTSLGAGGPSPREDALMVYVPSRQSLLLYGGRRSGRVFTDTWEWVNGRWREIATTTNPGELQHASAAYDEKRERMVIFGGAIGRGFQAATWELAMDGNWKRATPGSSPPARIGHSMAFDVASASLLLYGGFAASGPFTDLWRWNGTEWIDEKISGPTTTEGAAMAATPDGLMVTGPGTTRGPSTRAWRRVSGAWLELPASNAPALAVGAATLYDKVRKRLVVIGGAALDDRAGTRVAEHTGTRWEIR